MVYTKVEIWYGIILTKKQCIKIIWNDKMPEIDENDLIYEIKDKISYKTHLDVEILNPCGHVDDDVIIIGRRVAEYKRSKFDVDDIVDAIKKDYNFHCGTKVCGIDIGDGEFCGKYRSCNNCFCSTTNGSYPVYDIGEGIIKANYCFYCNNDKCNCRTKELNDEEINSELDDFCNEHDLKINVESYYRLDDCCYCT